MEQGTSRTRSTETFDGLVAIQAQLNNIGREIKKVNEKLYVAQVGCKQCKGPHYTKDCPLKKEGKTLEEAYYTQFGSPFQGGGYRATASKEQCKSFVPRMKIRASTDAAIRNQGASIKTLEIQIRQISKNITLVYETKQTTILFPSHLNSYYCEGKKGSYRPQFLDAYSKASHINNSIPQKEKDLGSFTLPCFINNVCFDNALVDLGASVSVMPLPTYLNLGLGELAHTKFTVELADRTVKYPKGIAENVLVGIGKSVFPVDFIILDMPEDIKVPLILGRPFLSTTRAKIDVYKRKITLRGGEERITFTSIKPASSLIKRVYMLSLRERMELDLEARLMGETLLRINQCDDLMPTINEGEVIEELKTKDDELDTGIDDYPSYYDYDKKIHINCAHNLKFSCMIGYEFTHANLFPLLYVNVMSKKFHNSIMKDKMVYKGNNVVGALMNVPIFVRTFYVVTNFVVLEDMDAYHDERMGNVSDEDKKNGISHPYQKLKGFYKGVLNLGPDYIRDAKMEEWLIRGHISIHEIFPLLNQGDYDMTKLRIKQYIQLEDYALWEKNDVKARSILMMALPNEHQLTFNQYRDAKTLFEAIQSRFGGNDATKKNQKTLLKQMYENFNALSSESLDSIFNRLQKIVSQLSILGENISQEDLNLKFLRSLPTEWNTHVNMAFVSSPSSAYDVNTANVHVSTASTSDNSASLSDATVYAFLANQPNGSQLVHEDLEQIHEDDLEVMDLKWQLALLSMRARRYFQKTGKKITINGSDTAGYDKTKVECFNCHKLRHFARECRNPRSQESRPRNYDKGNRNPDSSRRTVNVEDTSSKAMVAIDGAGFDWSFMAEEEVPTNMARMALSDSEVYNNKTCSNTCLKSYETLKSRYDNLRIELNKYEFDLANYNRGLASVEEQLVFYKKNEGMLCDQIAVLKRDASFYDSEINALNIQIERLKKEKESNQIKIDNFENASKSLDKLIGSQISDNNKKGMGYNVVPPPPTGLFEPPTIDLSNSGLEEFKQPEFEGYGVKVNKSVCENSSNEIKKTSDAPIIEDWVSDCDEDESVVKVLESVNSQQKPKQADETRKVSQNPRNNRTNRIELKTQKLGVGFQFTKKACFVCGSFNHLIKDCDFHDQKMVQKPVLNNVQKGTAVLTKSRIVPISTARQSSSRAAAPVSAARPINTAAPKPLVNVAKPRLNAFQKSHSLSRRPCYQQTALKNINLNSKVNTAKINYVYTAKGKKSDKCYWETKD
ncbi:ribonuclease H-like domain-containing protein [Tanacetum coccineum]